MKQEFRRGRKYPEGFFSAGRKSSGLYFNFLLWGCPASRAGWPDWSNFRLLGVSYLWTLFRNLNKKPKFLGYILFPRIRSFCQKNDWATFWPIFFTNSSGHPALGRPLIQLS
jgi:hypothetical protein